MLLYFLVQKKHNYLEAHSFIMFISQVFGGLVLSLVASTLVDPPNPQAYVISVAIFCFIVSFLWLMVFACGSHRNKSTWASAVGS